MFVLLIRPFTLVGIDEGITSPVSTAYFSGATVPGLTGERTSGLQHLCELDTANSRGLIDVLTAFMLLVSDESSIPTHCVSAQGRPSGIPCRASGN